MSPLEEQFDQRAMQIYLVLKLKSTMWPIGFVRRSSGTVG